MSKKLDDFISNSVEKLITDEEEIYEVCEDLLRLKLSDIAPNNVDIKQYPYRYVVKTMLNSFKIDTEKYMDEMSLEEFIFLFMLAMREGDFTSEEDNMFVNNYHATRCFRDLQCQKLAESMLSATHNSIVRKFLNVSVDDFLTMIAIKNVSGNAIERREEIISIIENLMKDKFTSNMTMKYVFELSKSIGLQPWFPGTLLICQYVVRAKMNVSFVSQLLADSLDELFQISQKYDASEILNKYKSSYKLVHKEMEEDDE